VWLSGDGTKGCFLVSADKYRSVGAENTYSHKTVDRFASDMLYDPMTDESLPA
jgi:hypothetical protein